jgi:hypothetical protein
LEYTFALANVYYAEGRYAEAERLAQRVADNIRAYEVPGRRERGGRPAGPRSCACGTQALLPDGAATAGAEHLLASAQRLPWKKCLQALVTLYDTWDKAAPGGVAAMWKAALAGTG